jgi:hypothetical protein
MDPTTIEWGRVVEFVGVMDTKKLLGIRVSQLLCPGNIPNAIRFRQANARGGTWNIQALLESVEQKVRNVLKR